MLMHHNVIIRFLLAAVMAWSAINCNAQQITMKAGAALGKVDSREIGGEIHRMLNVYWETNYALRIATFRFVTFGLSYLGTGGKFSDTYVPTYYNYDYHVKARYNNVLAPIKFKVTTEHRKKPRLYGFTGFAPGIMFYEARDITFDGKEPDPKHDAFLFDWTARRFQIYLLVGGGVYYRHIILDIGAYVSTFKNYKEFMAPIVHNSGLMLTVGYQVSRDETKRW
ncbi:MAG: hypothetical protein II852_06565 [Bacteroidales bacterium]|nr:hypothetical protein [Bacteroidales bacterium]